MIRLLVSKGCDLNSKDYEGRTALQWAEMMNFHAETQTLKGKKRIYTSFIQYERSLLLMSSLILYIL